MNVDEPEYKYCQYCNKEFHKYIKGRDFQLQMHEDYDCEKNPNRKVFVDNKTFKLDIPDDLEEEYIKLHAKVIYHALCKIAEEMGMKNQPSWDDVPLSCKDVIIGMARNDHFMIVQFLEKNLGEYFKKCKSSKKSFAEGYFKIVERDSKRKDTSRISDVIRNFL